MKQDGFTKNSLFRTRTGKVILFRLFLKSCFYDLLLKVVFFLNAWQVFIFSVPLRASCLFQILYLEADFYPQLSLRELIYCNLESWFVFRSQLNPSIQLAFSRCAGLQMFTQYTPRAETLLPATGIEPTPFRNYASEKVKLQVYGDLLRL